MGSTTASFAVTVAIMFLDLKRLTRGERVTGVCGTALLLFMLLLNWFGLQAPGGFGAHPASPVVAGGLDRNAFEAFTVIDLIALGAGVSALALTLLAARHIDRGLPPARIAFFVGLLAFILIAIRIIDPPNLAFAPTGLPGGAQSVHVEDFAGAGVSREMGVWLGLFASAGLTIGAYITVTERDAPRKEIRITSAAVGTR
jgi:hypothetical protein